MTHCQSIIFFKHKLTTATEFWMNNAGAYIPFAGDRCEGDVYECLSLPCQHGGTCREWTSGRAGFDCLCPATFSGQFCEVDELSCEPAPCLHGATCVQTVSPKGGQRRHIITSDCYSIDWFSSHPSPHDILYCLHLIVITCISLCYRCIYPSWNNEIIYIQ